MALSDFEVDVLRAGVTMLRARLEDGRVDSALDVLAAMEAILDDSDKYA